MMAVEEPFMRFAVRRVMGCAIVGLAMGLLGCAPQKPPPPAVPNPTAAPATGGAGGMDLPAFPPGAQSTLLCNTFGGPAHIVEATRAKEYLKYRTGSDQWYVIHSADESDLFYGFYSTDDERAQDGESRRALADRLKLSSLKDEDGRPMFAQVLFVPINPPDPPAPKEWEVTSNPGFWTLQIGVYRDSPQRKQAAIDTVRDLRANGIDAYYHHGDVMSFVYIGSWPREAVKEQQTSAKSNDPNQPLMVMSGPLAGAENAQFQTRDGRKMKVVMPKLEILDPTLKQATEKYPYTYVNGEGMGRKVTKVDGSITVVPYPSYLIQLRPDTNASSADKSDSQEPAPAPTSDVPGLGGLR
jgi:hypothetical protein